MTASQSVGRPRQCPDGLREEVVRLRGDGWSLRKIASHMNEAGRPTPAGKASWTQNTVDNLLATRHVREMIEAEIEQCSVERGLQLAFAGAK